MGLLSNKISKEDLKAGDHIYSWRTAYIYAHHGIYAGNEKVIHFTRGGGQEVGTGTVLDRIIFSSSPSNQDTPCARCGDQNLDGVISSCIDCFLAGCDLYRFDYSVSPAFFLAKARGGTCTLAASDPPADVLYRASYLLQNGFGAYKLFSNNCEDFAIYCKTGLLVLTSISVGRSGQLTSLLAASSAIVSSPLRYLTTSFSGLSVVAGCMYCVSRFVSDIGIRRDVTKVPVERLDELPSLDEPGARTVDRVIEELPSTSQQEGKTKGHAKGDGAVIEELLSTSQQEGKTKGDGAVIEELPSTSQQEGKTKGHAKGDGAVIEELLSTSQQGGKMEGHAKGNGGVEASLI